MWQDEVSTSLTDYAANLFHVNTGKEPGCSFVEEHNNCNNCNHEIAAFIYSSGTPLVVANYYSEMEFMCLIFIKENESLKEI